MSMKACCDWCGSEVGADSNRKITLKKGKTRIELHVMFTEPDSDDNWLEMEVCDECTKWALSKMIQSCGGEK